MVGTFKRPSVDFTYSPMIFFFQSFKKYFVHLLSFLLALWAQFWFYGNFWPKQSFPCQLMILDWNNTDSFSRRTKSRLECMITLRSFSFANKESTLLPKTTLSSALVVIFAPNMISKTHFGVPCPYHTNTRLHFVFSQYLFWFHYGQFLPTLVLKSKQTKRTEILGGV